MVMCHTDPSRLPSDNDLSLNLYTVENRLLHGKDGDNHDMPERLAIAGTLYYEQLISYDFHMWTMQQWFYELDHIIEHHRCIEKVIHLFCFDGYFHHFKKGVSVCDFLINHSIPNGSSNHMDSRNNSAIGNTLASIIEAYPGDGNVYDGRLI